MRKDHVTIARKSFFSCGVERESCGNSGFNYSFEVYIDGPIDPVSGLVINLTDVKTVLKKITGQFDQKHLNYDLLYDDVSLASVHQKIHELFKNEFQQLDLKDITLKKSLLYEGLSDISTIIV